MNRSHSNSRFSRRNLLAGLGLSAGMLPLLNASSSWAAPVFPKRLVIIQWCNGILSDYFWPKSGGETDFVLNECTAPLEPFRKDIILMNGLGLKVQKDDTRGDSGNPFSGYGGHAALPYLLTGAFPGVGKADGQAYPVGGNISIDQYVANAIGSKTPIKSLEMGGVELDSNSGQRAISFRGPAVGSNPAQAQDNRPEIDPAKVFARIMGAGGHSTVDDTTLARVRTERKSIYDAVLADLNRLQKRVGTDDRAKIESHAQFVRGLEDELTQLKAVSCNNVGTAPTGFAANRSDGPKFDKVAKANLDLSLTALRCDITRVITMMWYGAANNLVSFPFLGTQYQGPAQHKDTGSAPSDFISHHEMAHNSGSSDGDPDRRRKVGVDKWHVQQLAYFLDGLKKTPEGTGTMLDNTVVLFANNMSNGGAHSTNNLPWILAGQAGGYFKTGRYLKFSSDGWTPHNGLLVALANAMDVPAPNQGGAQYFGETRYPGELTTLKG